MEPKGPGSPGSVSEAGGRRRAGPWLLVARALRLCVRPAWALALVESGALMGVAELAVRYVRIERAASWFGATLSFAEPAPSTEAVPVLLSRRERVSLTVLAKLARHWPLSPEPGGSCLRHSLAASYFLRRRQPQLRLGVAMDERRGVLAHAWVEVEGRAVTNPGDYQPLLSSPSWPRATKAGYPRARSLAHAGHEDREHPDGRASL